MELPRLIGVFSPAAEAVLDAVADAVLVAAVVVPVVASATAACESVMAPANPAPLSNLSDFIEGRLRGRVVPVIGWATSGLRGRLDG